MSEFIDSILIPNRLQVGGYSVSESIAMYGVITGMAAVVAYMPSMVTASLSYTVTIRIAARYQVGEQRKHDIEKILSFVWIWGIFSGLFIFLYAQEASSLIFGTLEAAQPIRYLSAIPLIVGMRELTTSILWARERKPIPLVGLLLGILISAAIQYVLLAVPGLGYAGAAIGILVMETVAVIWNMRVLRGMKICLYKFNWLGWNILTFSTCSLLLIPPLLQEDGQLVTTALSALFYWIVAFFLIGLRYRNKQAND